MSVKGNATKDLIEGLYRLSGLQHGMLFHGLYDNAAGSYVKQFACDLVGVNLEAVDKSWQYILKQHSILRSGFIYDEFTVPVQCVFREVIMPIEVLDYTLLSKTEQDKAILQYQVEDRAKGFDFKTPPLMRLALIRLDENRYRMLWTSHHILIDGWSMPILMEEFLNVYELLSAGKQVPVKEVDRYEDYIRYIESINKEQEGKYWRNYMNGIDQNTLLPFIGKTTERTKGLGVFKSTYLNVDGDIAARVQSYAQAKRLTVNSLMQAVWSYLLHRYTGSNDIVYGVIVSGRPDNLPGVEKRVGMYINTLPMRSRLNDDQGIVEWIKGLQSGQVSSRQYQHTPLQNIQALTGVQGDLFDSLLVFENYPISKVIGARKWSLQVENIWVHEQSNYPLTLIIFSGVGQLSIRFSYNPELLDEKFIDEIKGHFENVLLQLIENTSNVISDLKLITSAEEQQLKVDFNANTVTYPTEKNIISLFEEQVEKTPDSIALVFGTKKLSYKELNERSNQFANYLKNRGVIKESLVPICVDRSLEMLIGIFGILKAGGAYVPIDSEHPMDRIGYMLEDTAAVLVVASKDTRSKLPDSAGIEIIEIDTDWESISNQPLTRQNTIIDAGQLAYVIYTSGSTGRPKGVMIEHKGVVNLSSSQRDALRLQPAMKSLQFASAGFDASCYEIFNTLLSGGTLVLPAKDDLLDAASFEKLISKNEVEVVVLPPSYLHVIKDHLGTIKTIVSAGEPLTEAIARYIQAKGIRLINAYGPTETTVCVSLTDEPVTENNTIVIGKPIANVRVYILDKSLNLSPVGTIGEIHTGGVQVARGYLNRPELTAEKFIANPFSNETEARIYKTGDLGRWLPDGNIEYLGRADDQVKIRGYRIELGEIEQVLVQSKMVEQAVVLAKEDKQGQKRLVAYLVKTGGSFSKQDFANYLNTRLPEYMVPAFWVELENFPLTINGKIDRKALPDPDAIATSANEYVVPRNELESKLTIIWQQLLSAERIGINDNFFELGGNSLLAMRGVSSIRKELDLEVSIKELFIHPTIGALADHLQAKGNKSSIPAIKISVPRPDRIPLSFNQERLWFVDRLEGSVPYHIPAVLKLDGRLNKNALEYALRNIIWRHEILRTVVREQEGKSWQHIMSADAWEIDVVDGSKYHDDKPGLKSLIEQLINKPFNLSQDYMLRAALIQLEEQVQILVVTTHHIASDGWSMSVIVKEVAELYKAFENGQRNQQNPLPVQYADYSIWQRNYLQGEELDNKLAYWKNKLEAVAPLQLPTDFARPSIQSTKGAIAGFRIEKELFQDLQQLSQQNESTLFMTLVAAINVLLYRYSGQEDICVGTGSAGRQQQELEGLVGFFVNTLALRNEVNAQESFNELLNQVKATTLEAFANQDLPFDRVVDSVIRERDMSRTPLFQVMVAWQNTPDVPELQLGDVQLSVESFARNTSKYDLTFSLTETAVGLQGSLEYCTDLFTPERIVRMLNHFKELLKSIVKNPSHEIGSFSMLTPEEGQQLTVDFNANKAIYPTDKSLIHLFEEQVAKTPDSIALLFDENELSYQELNERSNQLANYLLEKGIAKESLVAICIDRSLEMVIAILGILKAGGAYLPIDPEHPLERISYMLEDSGAKWGLCNEDTRSKLPDTGSTKIIGIDADWDAISKQPSTNPGVKIESSQLAYVIYTSGSTGRPKGVLVEQRGVVNLCFSQSDSLKLKPGTKLLQFASSGFDASCNEIFSTLLSGGSLVICKKMDLLSSESFEKLVNKHQVEIAILPPSFQYEIKDSLGTIKTVVSAGEPLNETTGRHLQSKGIRLLNAYGPTENTVCTTQSDDPIKENNILVIGKPITNVEVYILDQSKNLSPIGAYGEIHVGGIQVARGYLNRPELTDEKFIPNPFGKEPGSRLYRTGDVGRWLADGNIEYFGRIDDQVKIRGYRIELGEIESCINAMDGIIDARVIVSDNEALNDKKLNAYLQVDKDRLPLLSNYLKLLNKNAVKQSDLNIMPNGLPIINSNLNEVRFLYDEIFAEHSYLKHGITLKEDSCVFDIGANVGFFSVFLNVLSDKIKVYSVEPIPEVYNFLVANRELYNVQGKAFELAILDKEQEIEFTYYPLVSALSSITQEKSQKDAVRSFIRNTENVDLLEEEIDSLLELKLESRQVKCKAKTLSQIIAEEAIEKIDLLKIDVENSEHLVIGGIADKDWAKIENLIIEVHDVDGRLNELKEMMEAKGYTTFVEKETMLSEDDVLYNLFALKSQPVKGLSELDGQEEERKQGWQDPVELVKDIRTDAEQKLPAYMIPSQIILLDQFPQTRNGKVDKKALLEMKSSEMRVSQYESAASEVEKSLTSIWMELLELDQVGIHDDFFELGGHSLLAVRLISAIRKELSVELPISDIFDYPTISLLSAQMKNQADSLILPAIEVAVRPNRIPLSFSQERLWFIDQLEGSVQYHLPTVLRLKGKLDLAALTFALKTIVNRHEVLRTVYLEENGQAYQLIKEEEDWQLPVINGAQFRDDRNGLQNYIHQLINKPFDLAKDPTLRVNLVAIDEQDHVLVVTMHHIASDAWSISILVKEVVELYSAFTENRPALLSPVQFQYADYALWQRNYLQGDLLDKKIGYWKEKLNGVSPLQLPVDYARPAVQTMRGATKSLAIDKSLSEKIQALSQQMGTTQFMTLLAAFKVMLYRYSGQQDICVGTSVASREQKDVENLIGFFINTLAFRSEVSGEKSFTELLQEVRTTVLDAYANLEVPFEKVVEAVVRDRDMSRSSLFQVMLVFQNTPEIPKLVLGEVEMSGEFFDHDIAKFDLTFFITETSQGFQGSVGYSTDLFSEQTIIRMIGHFKELLSAIVAAPAQKIGKLHMITVEEEQQVLIDFNKSEAAYPKDKSVVDLFEKQVSKTPLATALVFENEQLSYGELNERSNQLANYLQRLGVKEESLVPICMERGIDMMVAVLGVLKTGAAYVPIDIDFPADRIRYMLEDTDASVVLSSSSSSSKLDDNDGLKIIELDTQAAFIGLQPTDNLATKVNANQLAYVIYTSGSTGAPKGVMIEHQSLVDYVVGLNQKLAVEHCRSFALVSTLATDLGNTVVFSSLLLGGALHVFAKESVSNAAYLHEYFRNHPIDCLKIVASHWQALSMDERLLLPTKLLVFGGEALQSALVKAIRLSGADCMVVNHYGPTETTIGKLLHVVDWEQSYSATIPIGKPFSNTSVYVLNKDFQLCPVGVPGQLYISGDGVARGYLNNPGLTREKFITNPFNRGEQPLMYGTGDLVKYLPGGDIEFIGRVDEQVKIRGYRVEPGEIENVLKQCELVSQAVVLAKDDKLGNKRLIAYVVTDHDFDKEGIFSYLKEHLPEYMVPSLIMELASLPLMANGKIDRKALPDPELTDMLANQYTAPRNNVEKVLAGIWENLLEVEQVGIHDDFFELGGHSLLAVRVISAIRKQLEVEMPISDIFDYPSINLLAAQMESQSDAIVLPAIEVKVRPALIPLSFSQERLWFIDRLEGSVQYHLPTVLRLKGKLDKIALDNALKAVVDRHEVLRTIFIEDHGQAYQQIKPAGEWGLLMIDGSAYQAHPDLLEKRIQQLINEAFDLSKDNMLRAALISLGADEHILVAIMHHIASDAWSTSVLVKEVVELYDAFTGNRPARLTTMPMQFADYAIWQRNYLQGEVLENKLNYWKNKLDNVAPIELPTDFKRPAVSSPRGAWSGFMIDKELADQLNKISQQEGTSLFMTLLAAFKILLHRTSGQQDICVGTSIASREQQELESLIGFFVNTIALRSEISSEKSFREILQQERVTTLEAYANHELPFEKVVETVVRERDMSRSPVFQVMLVLQNTPDVPTLRFGEVELFREPFKHNIAKFDLTFFMNETVHGLQCSAGYCTDLFSEATIQRMIAHFKELVASIVKAPDQQIGELKMISPTEEQILINGFNMASVDYPTEKSIIDLFEEQVIKTPAATALVFEDQQLSFQELNEKANQLAHHLVLYGVKKETLVPVCIERGIDMMVAILAILKAGGAYVPIDTDFPQERISYMLEDTAATIVLCSSKSSMKLDAMPGLIELDTQWESISTRPLINLSTKVSPDQLAYVIYTSGSTGQPKGVMVEHHSLVDYVYGLQKNTIIGGCHSFALVSTIATDLGNTVIFNSLLQGGALHIFSKESVSNIEYLHSYFNTHSIDCLKIVPSHWRALCTDEQLLMPAKLLVFGGEALPASLVLVIRSAGSSCQVVNHYGPTETTIGKLLHVVDDQRIYNNTIPIGKPFSNTCVYVLSNNLQPCPVGIPGQLFIAGNGVARGYFNNIDLTHDKFITNPFVNDGSVMYATGDRVKFLQGGDIEFIGRVDEQVKIRGYRIEPGEISAVLEQHRSVNQALVMAKTDKQGDKYLAAYVVPSGDFDQEELTNYLKEKLPEYMVPPFIIELAAMPLTANGKINRKALPDPDASQLLTNEYVAPRNENEQKMAAIWQEVLGVEKVGVFDDFFKLGGHSLLAVRMVYYIERNLLISIPINVIFELTTISDLVSYLEVQVAMNAKENTPEKDKSAVKFLKI